MNHRHQRRQLSMLGGLLILPLALVSPSLYAEPKPTDFTVKLPTHGAIVRYVTLPGTVFGDPG